MTKIIFLNQEPLDHFQSKLTQAVFWWQKCKIVQTNGPARFKMGNNNEIAEIYWWKYKLNLQNHWTILDQTLNKAFLSERDSSLFKCRARYYPRRDNKKLAKIQYRIKKCLLQNHSTNFNKKSAQCIFMWSGIQFLKTKNL